MLGFMESTLTVILFLLFDVMFSCVRLQEDNLIIQNTVLEEDIKTSFGLDTD